MLTRRMTFQGGKNLEEEDFLGRAS